MPSGGAVLKPEDATGAAAVAMNWGTTAPATSDSLNALAADTNYLNGGAIVKYSPY